MIKVPFTFAPILAFFLALGPATCGTCDVCDDGSSTKAVLVQVDAAHQPVGGALPAN
jgi:hypothetical protein